MALPIIPIEIWAQGDVILPNTHELNKERPINDLWYKGWDLGEKPAAEEFNYVLNMLSSWTKYISEEQIPGLDGRYLQKSLNLSDVADVSTARNNLSVWSKAEADTRYVDVSGDSMTGPLSVPRLNLQASPGDTSYITTTNPASDWTYTDFVIGGDVGTAGNAGVDTMRFRFLPDGGSIFTMFELNAITTSAALARITGNLIVSGSIQSSSLTTTNATITNATVNNTLTVNNIVATTITATNITATNNISAGNNVSTNTLTVNSAATVQSLNVTSQSAIVGGRNVVRAINGVEADANGNLSLTVATTTASLGTNGWFKDSTTGMIMQWGYVGSTNSTFAFPIAFPNVCLNFMASNADRQGDRVDNAYGYPVNNASFFIATRASSNGGVSPYPCFWIAIGY